MSFKFLIKLVQTDFKIIGIYSIVVFKVNACYIMFWFVINTKKYKKNETTTQTPISHLIDLFS